MTTTTRQMIKMSVYALIAIVCLIRSFQRFRHARQIDRQQQSSAGFGDWEVLEPIAKSYRTRAIFCLLASLVAIGLFTWSFVTYPDP